MHKIFKIHYEKYLNKYLKKSEGGQEIKQILNFNKKYIPIGGSLVLIKKFPVQELKNIARLECNIDRLNNDDDIHNTIWASKKLRYMLKIQEKAVCFNCSKKFKCKFFEEIFQPPETKSKKIEEKINGNMTDLQIILNGLYKIAASKDMNTNMNSDDGMERNLLDKEEISHYNSVSNSDNDSESENESEENFSNSKILKQTQNYYNSDSVNDIPKIYSNTNDTHKYPQFTTDDPIFKRISNKEWSSASILSEIINETMEDFLFNNGIAFRTLLNAYLEAKKEEEHIELLSKEKEKQIEQDPVIKLLEDLKKCKNRKEKRRLLAKYNKTADFGWGEYFKINKKVDDYAKEAEKEEETATSNAEKNKQILEKEKLKNNNNNNTVLITESKLKRINTAKTVASLKTLNFSQRITSKTAQKKYLESQQNLSLLTNQARDGDYQIEERTNIKLPGKDINRAIKYLESRSAGDLMDKNNHEVERQISFDGNDIEIKKFNSFIEEKKRENTVDIASNIKRKLGKLDKKLEENKKYTLIKMIDTKMIQNRNKNIEIEGDLNMIEGGNIKNRALEEFSSKLPLIKNNKIQIENETEESSLIEIKNSQNELSLNIKREDIFIERISTSNDESQSESQIAFYKQKNLAKQEKIKKKQFESKINKIIKDKHIYKSQNFYNNTNMEHIPYETDSNISRTIRFEKTIKKEREDK